jgi:hypothetical protein
MKLVDVLLCTTTTVAAVKQKQLDLELLLGVNETWLLVFLLCTTTTAVFLLVKRSRLTFRALVANK